MKRNGTAREAKAPYTGRKSYNFPRSHHTTRKTQTATPTASNTRALHQSSRLPFHLWRLEPHACPSAVLRDELDAGLFEGGTDGIDSALFQFFAALQAGNRVLRETLAIFGKFSHAKA